MKRWLFLCIVCSGCSKGCERPDVPASAPVERTVAIDAVAALPDDPTLTWLRVPHVAQTPDLQRRDDEKAWQDAAWTKPFRESASMAPARPYSGARILWSDEGLLLSLYAADEDVRTLPSQPTATDADGFDLQIATETQKFTLRLGPKGVLAATRDGQPWQVNPTLAIDVDGSVDDLSGEDDEEWAVFLAIPWPDLGVKPAIGQKFHVTFGRCDTPKVGGQRCGQWGEGLTGILELAGD